MGSSLRFGFYATYLETSGIRLMSGYYLDLEDVVGCVKATRSGRTERVVLRWILASGIVQHAFHCL